MHGRGKAGNRAAKDRKTDGPWNGKNSAQPGSFRKTEAGNIKPEMYGTQDVFPAACGSIFPADCVIRGYR